MADREALAGRAHVDLEPMFGGIDADEQLR
jgi:hypothetical protein